MPLEFRKECLGARFRSPDGTDWVERNCEVRFDPLLGSSSRIAEGVKLQTADAGALEEFRHPDPACPFCPERIERVTPRIRPEICPEGRIRLGDTLVFPNLVPYSQYAAVAVFSPHHWLSLEEFTPDLLASNLAAALRYIRSVRVRFQGSALRVQHQLSVSIRRLASSPAQPGVPGPVSDDPGAYAATGG